MAHIKAIAERSDPRTSQSKRKGSSSGPCALGGEPQRRDRESKAITQRFRDLSSSIVLSHEGERKRAAQTIHEGLAQTLVSANVRMEQLVSTLGQKSTAEVTASVNAIISILRDSVEEIRAIQERLWPLTLDDLGLIPAIRSLCRLYEKVHPLVRVQACVHGEDVGIPGPLRISIYRSVEDLLDALTGHDRDTFITVRLHRRGRRLFLELRATDTTPRGKALSEGPIDPLGIELIRHRVQISGGIFLVVLQCPKYVQVRCVWKAEEASEAPGLLYHPLDGTTPTAQRRIRKGAWRGR